MKRVNFHSIVAALALVSITGATSVSAVPIAGTGFVADVIAEKEGATPGSVTNTGALANWRLVEAGAPNINHLGLPDSSSRLFTTKNGTDFLLQPYNQSNLLLTNSTFTLDTPAKYEDLQFFVPGVGGNTANNFSALVNFMDGSSTLLQTTSNDWQASRSYNAVDVRMAIVGSGNWTSYFGNGIFMRELSFVLSAADQAKTVNSIRFTLLDRMGVLAVSGTAISNAVPEPATATLGLLGFAGMMLRRRRAA